MLKEYFIQNKMIKNKLKNLFKSIWIILLLVSITNTFAKTIVSGRIEELKKSQVFKLAFFTNRINYEENVIYTKITDNGYFEFQFELDHARTFHLKYNEIISEEFFVAPGDSLFIETTLYTDLIALNKGVDNLVSIRKPEYDYDEKSLNKEIKKWAKNPSTYFEKRRKKLIPSETYSHAFSEYSAKIIDYRLAYDKMRFALIAKNLLGEKKWPDLNPKYYSFIDTLNLNDTAFLEIEEYQYMIMAYMHYQYKKENSKALDNRFPIKYQLAERLLDGQIKEFYQTVLLFNAYEQGKGEENKEILDDFLKVIQNTHYKELLEYQQKNYVKIDPLVIGKEAPLFELRDNNGYLIPLNKFKGQVIYLEFWASWCVPCLQQIPYTETLKEKYHQIVFMYISLDEHEEEWKKMIEKKNIKGTHFRINSVNKQDTEVLQKYHVDSVPTYFIIDKEGKLVSIDAPRPSDKKQLHQILNSLL